MYQRTLFLHYYTYIYIIYTIIYIFIVSILRLLVFSAYLEKNPKHLEIPSVRRENGQPDDSENAVSFFSDASLTPYSSDTQITVKSVLAHV